MREFLCAAVLFDLDGVLVDSRGAVERQWSIWAAAHGLDPPRVLHVAHGRPTVERYAFWHLRLLPRPRLPRSSVAKSPTWTACERCRARPNCWQCSRLNAGRLLPPVPAPWLRRV